MKESCIDDKVTSILVAFCWNCISYKEIYNAFGKDYISSIQFFELDVKYLCYFASLNK